MSFIRPNMVFLATVFVVLLIIISLAQEVNRRWQVQSQIHVLQNQVDGMQQHVVELTQLNEYFRTSDYKERLAREQLNYRAPGEKVVLIPEKDSTSKTPLPENQSIKQLPNALAWWHLFFAQQTTQ